MTAPLRIALLTHSTNPRGGVVHSLELGDALTRLGHDVTVHAPDPSGVGFFRPTLCRTTPIAATPAGRDVTAMVEVRVNDYLRHFERDANRRFDVWHAQDGISANALATLKERGLIAGFARTVHHVDHFADSRLSALQLRAITAAECLFAVSQVWRDWLARRFDRAVILAGNGVDIDRYTPVADANDEDVRTMLNLPVLDQSKTGNAPVFLAVGGVEERKNTLRILQAFARVHTSLPAARLVIAGGASLLDHDAYQAEFAQALSSSGLPESAVIRTGPIADALMPALYRAADALVFPSVKEGFGLVVLEAMASGIPVVTSRIAPFTEYLGDDDVVWCEPDSIELIAKAMTASLDPSRRAALVGRGLRLAARHGWRSVAQAHLPAYANLREPAHA